MHVYTFLLHVGGDVSSGDASQGVTPSVSSGDASQGVTPSGDASQGVTPSVVNKEGTAMQTLMQNPSKVEQESQAQGGYEF